MKKERELKKLSEEQKKTKEKFKGNFSYIDYGVVDFYTIKILKDGVVTERGLRLEKVNGKIDCEDLGEKYLKEVLNEKLFKTKNKRWFKGDMKFIPLIENGVVEISTVEHRKKIDFIVNEKLVFVLRKVKKELYYIISEQAILKAMDELYKYLSPFFAIKKKEYEECNGLIEAAVAYLI